MGRLTFAREIFSGFAFIAASSGSRYAEKTIGIRRLCHREPRFSSRAEEMI
jgi:hypothetical protein